MEIKNEILIRIYSVLGILMLAALAIFIKTARIQIVEGPYWQEKRSAIHIDFRPVKAERGSIMAQDGSLLASSLPFYEIRMDTRPPAMTQKIFDENVDTLAGSLMPWVKDRYSTKADFRNALIAARANNKRYFFIAKSVTYPELQVIKTFPLFNLGSYAGGIIVNRQSKRSKPYKMLAHRTIGYVNGERKVGLEEYYDDVLSGESGKQLMQRVSGGQWIPLNEISEIEPKRGSDIITTIDIDIQDVAGNALLKALKKYDAAYGCAIVMEVKTGAIKAIANIGKTKKGNYYENYNHAVGTGSEPGSTFKLATIMALLEDKAVDLDDTIFLNKGQYEFYGEPMQDASYHLLDSTTVRKAFEISSNVGMAKMTFDNYEKRGKRTDFVKRLKQFHLDKNTGIEITGEKSPYIKSPNSEKDNWSGTTIPWMSIGYEMEITPLQLLTFYNAVANNGRMMKPYLVSAIQEYGEVTRTFPPIAIDEQIARPSTIKKAKELLEGVVEKGTANNIRPNSYRIAGKTGTAQRNYAKLSKGEALKYQASFAGYFPANNPVYSCIVVITDPQGEFYGSRVAAPVFKEIADKCHVKETASHVAVNERPRPEFTHRQLPVYSIGYTEDYKTALSYLGLNYNNNVESDWTIVDIDSSSMLLQGQRQTPKKVVPNVKGMGLRDAVYKLEEQGITVFVAKGKGKVVEQSVPPGRTVKMGMRMYLTLK